MQIPLTEERRLSKKDGSMENPATDATPDSPNQSGKADTTAISRDSVTPNENSSETPQGNEIIEHKGSTATKDPKELKTFTLISWLSVTLSFLPLIVLVVIADGYDTIQRFSPTESLFFPVIMFTIAYIGSRYARKANNSITKGLNAIFGTFYFFLLMLYFASGIVGGIDAVLIIPLLLPVVLPVVFIWLLGIRVTLSKLRKHPVDEDGKPVDPKALDPLKTTLPDKTFAEIVFQILGVFTSILLGYYITSSILQLL